jgi:hypothetical protein
LFTLLATFSSDETSVVVASWGALGVLALIREIAILPAKIGAQRAKLAVERERYINELARLAHRVPLPSQVD